MTTDALIVAARQTFDTILATLASKSREYSKPHDAFSAYRLAEDMGICTTDQNMLGRCCEKWARLLNHWKQEEAIDEDVIDLIGILVHLKEYKRE